MNLEGILEKPISALKTSCRILKSKENRKAIGGFLFAFPTSLAISSALSQWMKNNDYDTMSNTALTFVARNILYFSIYVPTHLKLHEEDYNSGKRNPSHEAMSVFKGSMVGTLSNLILQPSFHYLALGLDGEYVPAIIRKIPVWAKTGFAYISAGGFSTWLNGYVLYKKKVLKDPKQQQPSEPLGD